MPPRPREADAPLDARLIADFVRLRAPQFLAPREVIRLADYLADLHLRGGRLPAHGRGFRWSLIAARCGVDPDRLAAGRAVLAPLVARLHRAIRAQAARPPRRRAPGPATGRLFPFEAPRRAAAIADPAAFRATFEGEMRRRGLSPYALSRALAAWGYAAHPSTLAAWASGRRIPATPRSFAVLAAVERLWRLWPGDLSGDLPNLRGVDLGAAVRGLPKSERLVLRWHLPDDFARRDRAGQAEILAWICETVVRGGTDYRRFLLAARRHAFSIRFPGPHGEPGGGRRAGARPAPPALAAEVAALVAFKTAALTSAGLARSTRWASETAGLKAQHLGLLFGALAAPPEGPAAGRGVPLERLSLGLLVFPAVWDWYLAWRLARRGFYTSWEREGLATAAALTAPATGWIAQSPALARRLRPIPGLVSPAEIRDARADWAGACARLHAFARGRSRDLRRASRAHNDRFEPVRAVLEADAPVAVYSRIADEVLAERPCARRAPRAAAENARGFLMIRLALHTGFRQRNLRELLLCPPGAPFRSAQRLDALRRGELRWNARDQAWEIFAPPSAFKNAHSSFFAGRPYVQQLPDLGGLYREIDGWVRVHRPQLLRGLPDPGVFFVKRPMAGRTDAALNGRDFYGAYRRLIQRHGIFNPYTGRGAVAGLLPHGPHNVRDVVATHILKQTGSYEQASYAIQDTPETVARAYGRYLPQDKVGRAAEILNRVWAQTAPDPEDARRGHAGPAADALAGESGRPDGALRGRT